MKQIKLYEDFWVSNPEKRLISFSDFIYESRQTEDRARAILKELPNRENLIAQFRQGDKSNNKINIPLMAYLYTIQVNKNTEKIIELVNQYGELLVKKQIPSAEITKEGIKIGEQVFSDYLEFREHIYNSTQARSKDLKMGQNLEPKAKPIWSGNNIDIYEGDNKSKCIAYTQGGLVPGKSYEFCIGKLGYMNTYKAYRDNSVSTFYFIVDKNKLKINDKGELDDSDPLHMVVFNMTKSEPELTDASNHTGRIAQYGMDAEKYIEYLRSKGVPVDELLVNRPKTEQEIYEDELLGERNPDLEWFINLDKPENPNWRKPKLEQGDPEKSYYKFCYIGRNHILSSEQFDYLMKYKFDWLLQKYVDTGVQLPEYQVDNLTKELKNTYIRKRLIAVEQIEYGPLKDYEFKLLTQKERGQYAIKRYERKYCIPDEQFQSLTPEQQNEVRSKVFEIAMKNLENDHGISDCLSEILTQEQIGIYARKRWEDNWSISDYQFELITKEERFEYAIKIAETFWGISDEQFELLPLKQKIQYVKRRKEKGRDIRDYQSKLLTK
jgi:hypothetical protein